MHRKAAAHAQAVEATGMRAFVLKLNLLPDIECVRTCHHARNGMRTGSPRDLSFAVLNPLFAARERGVTCGNEL